MHISLRSRDGGLHGAKRAAGLLAHSLKLLAIPVLRLGAWLLALSLRTVGAVLHVLRAPVRFLFPKVLQAAGVATKATVTTVASNAKAIVRALRVALNVGKLLRAPTEAAQALVRFVSRHRRLIVPWILASCGIAFQMGYISAAQIVPYLTTALNPQKAVAFLWKVIAARMA